MSCYTCHLTQYARSLVIADGRHGRFHFDLKGRPLLIYTPHVHKASTLDLSGEELRASFQEVAAFMEAIELPDYQIYASFGNWVNHNHVHWKIRADERSVLALRKRHLASDRLFAQGGAHSTSNSREEHREVVSRQVGEAPQSEAAARAAAEGAPEEGGTSGLPDDPEVVSVPGDGACLFAATFLCFYHTSKGKLPDPNSARFKAAVQKLRTETVNYVVQHWTWPLGGIRGNVTGKESVEMEYAADPGCPEIVDKESYAAHMVENRTFGGQTELLALSALLNVCILVHPAHDPENGEKGIFFASRAGPRSVERRRNVGRRPVLHLLFDADTQHYDAIISQARSQPAES
ncbi:hypothetical protein KFL_006340090 [Klebsormidium nitens]|uniref:OTU domain-containing protein n=1 Tax=Klebsormidium nitens TaxID=105231 RepID=A0A1Y1IHN6_KLENI|nr:hypothetical protein KFL_006340090 [Klebsormidium nitens]|eukprot:GAQ90390.1 hypothetical protein KFL_006340090 [Klebsormidium nitens]